ncbi:protein AIR2-like [Ixodes scapularis]|uniref:protein AIR2-like n=1 Tax=Ixodes scapularis TaxID=6945 RepID=UPI001A9CD1EE|nr:protein AIR2-like [Ixodes scapularis]
MSETAIKRRMTDLLEPIKAEDARRGPQLCPDVWRRYHLTTEDGRIIRAPFKTRSIEERYCYNCAGQGHLGHQCHMKKRGNPGTAFFISYDAPRESQHQSITHQNNDGSYDNKPSVSNGGGLRKKKKNKKSHCSGKSMRLSNDAYRIEDILGHKRIQRFYTSTAPVDKLKRLNIFYVDIE